MKIDVTILPRLIKIKNLNCHGVRGYEFVPKTELQVSPKKPSEHWHENFEVFVSSIEQIPLFSHGFGSQGLSSHVLPI